MHLHVVVQDNRPWVIQSLARQVATHAPEGSCVSESSEPVDNTETVNFFALYKWFRKPLRHARSIIFCTHPEPNNWFTISAKMADAVVVMAQQYGDLLIRAGVPANRVHLIRPGVSIAFCNRKIRVFNPSLFAGNQRSQRKGLALWNALCATGEFDCVASNGTMSQEQVIDEYRRADVIVSTAKIEGGPMSVIEAHAMCKPFVGPRGVGWIDDLCEPAYEAGNLTDLKKKLYEAMRPWVCFPRTERDWARDIWALARRVNEGK